MAHQPRPHGGRGPGPEGPNSKHKSRNEKRWREGGRPCGDGGPGGFSNNRADHGGRDWNERNQRNDRGGRGFHRHGPNRDLNHVEGGPWQGSRDRRQDRRYDHRHGGRGDRRDDHGFNRGSPGGRGPSKGNDERFNGRMNDRWNDRKDDRKDDWKDERRDERREQWRAGRLDERQGDRRVDRRGRDWREYHQNEVLTRGNRRDYGGIAEHMTASKGPLAENPLPPLPPSPIIVNSLSELAKSQDLTYDDEKGISNVALLNSRLNVMDLRQMDKDIGSWAETEEQCQRMAMKLGLFAPEDNHRRPFSRDFLQRYTRYKAEKEDGAAGKEIEKAMPDPEGNKIGVIPYELATNDASRAEDPRIQFADEYVLLQAWVAKPLPLPAFAGLAPSNGSEPVAGSPTHSWSRSPTKMRSEAPLKRPADKRALGTPNAKQAKNAERSTLPHASSQHSLHSADSRYAEPQKMELEEGYFRVKLLNGDPALLQFGEIVDLIRKGELPDGWSAYRESDDLWVSVYEAQATDEATDMDVDAQDDGNDRSHEKHTAGSIADRRKDQEPVPLREEFVRAARVAKEWLGAKAPSAPKGLTAFSRKPSGTNASIPLSSEFSVAAKDARDDLSAYARVVALRSSAKLLCGAPKTVETGGRAMIKERVIEDRNRLRDIASGALQKALRIFIQRKTQSL